MMRKMVWVLVISSLAVFLTFGVAMACQNGDETDHEHPGGVGNCPGHVEKEASLFVPQGSAIPTAIPAAVTTGAAEMHPEGDETSHPHPGGVENCSGHGQSASLGWMGAIGIGALAGTGYLVVRRKRKK